MRSQPPLTPADRYLGIANAEIVEGIGRSDQELFSRLFGSYATPLVQWAYLLCHDKDLAEDIVADVFTYIWEIRGHWNVRTTVEAYLFGAVRVRTRSILRTDSRRGKIAEDFYASHERAERSVSTPGANIEHAELQGQVHGILARLSPRQREAVYARWYEEMSYDDIGALLDISALAARQLVFRAIGALRRPEIAPEK